MEYEFLSLVKSRRSVRGYEDRPVEPEKLDYALEAARLAPSACNKQPWRFVVVDDPELRRRICSEGMGPPVSNPWAVSAPVIIVVCVVSSVLVHTAGKVVKGLDYRMMDAGIAGEHLCLAAAEKGLGTCWIGWFRQKPIRRILGIPRSSKIVALITLGYAPDGADTPDKQRLEMDAVRSMNGYSLP